MADNPPRRAGTVLAVLLRMDDPRKGRKSRAMRVRVQWDGTISGEVWCDERLDLRVGDRVLAEIDGVAPLCRAPYMGGPGYTCALCGGTFGGERMHHAPGCSAGA